MSKVKVTVASQTFFGLVNMISQVCPLGFSSIFDHWSDFSGQRSLWLNTSLEKICVWTEAALVGLGNNHRLVIFFSKKKTHLIPSQQTSSRKCGLMLIHSLTLTLGDGSVCDFLKSLQKIGSRETIITNTSFLKLVYIYVATVLWHEVSSMK